MISSFNRIIVTVSVSIISSIVNFSYVSHLKSFLLGYPDLDSVVEDDIEAVSLLQDTGLRVILAHSGAAGWLFVAFVVVDSS